MAAIGKLCGKPMCGRAQDERFANQCATYCTSEGGADVELSAVRRVWAKWDARHNCRQCEYYLYYHEPLVWAQTYGPEEVTA